VITGFSMILSIYLISITGFSTIRSIIFSVPSTMNSHCYPKFYWSTWIWDEAVFVSVVTWVEFSLVSVADWDRSYLTMPFCFLISSHFFSMAPSISVTIPTNCIGFCL
jgi:hypothetical protein